MERLQLKTLAKDLGSYVGKTVVVAGWAKSIRDSKALSVQRLGKYLQAQPRDFQS